MHELFTLLSSNELVSFSHAGGIPHAFILRSLVFILSSVRKEYQAFPVLAFIDGQLNAFGACM